MTHTHERSHGRHGWVILCMAAAALALVAWFGLPGHGPHALRLVPWALLLLCTLLHLFMHRGGHGAHGGAAHAHEDPGADPTTGGPEEG